MTSKRKCGYPTGYIGVLVPSAEEQVYMGVDQTQPNRGEAKGQSVVRRLFYTRLGANLHSRYLHQVHFAFKLQNVIPLQAK